MEEREHGSKKESRDGEIQGLGIPAPALSACRASGKSISTLFLPVSWLPAEGGKCNCYPDRGVVATVDHHCGHCGHCGHKTLWGRSGELILTAGETGLRDNPPVQWSPSSQPENIESSRMSWDLVWGLSSFTFWGRENSHLSPDKQRVKEMYLFSTCMVSDIYLTWIFSFNLHNFMKLAL